MRPKYSLAGLLAVVAASAVTGCGGPGGDDDPKPRITGWADQNMLTWDAKAQEVAKRVDLPQARYVTSWDVAQRKSDRPCDLPCQRFQELKGWIERNQAEGKAVQIAFGDRVGCDGVCPLPITSEYETAVRAFLAEFPTVAEFAAWNEPNHRNRVTPEQAAEYWRVLDARCQETGRGACAVVAGDLNETGDFRQYTDAYKKNLAKIGAKPAAWAIHPYASIDSGDSAALGDWVDNYTDGKPVWFTEVGAFYCSPQRESGGGGLKGETPEEALRYQNGRAKEINELLAQMPARVDRAYYYFLAKPNGQQEACPGFDTALIGAQGVERPALRTLFPGS